MGRLPKIRVSYHNDAQYMMRLIHAIERDDARPVEWRRARIAELQNLATEFVNAPSASTSVKGKKVA